MKSSKLKFAFKTLIVFVALLLVSVFIAIQWPGLWLGPRTLNLAKNQINQRFENLRVDWSDSGVQTDPFGLLKNRILIRLNDFCFQQSNGTEACFDQLVTGFAYNLLKLTLTEIGPVRATGGELNLNLPDPVEKKTSEKVAKEENSDDFISWINKAEIKPIFIDIPKYSIQSPTQKLTGKFKAFTSSQAHAEGEDRSIHIEIFENSLGKALTKATSQTSLVEGPWLIDSSSSLQLPNKIQLRTEASLQQNDEIRDRWSYDIQTEYRSPSVDANAHLEGSYKDQVLASVLNGKLINPIPLAIQNCKIGFNLQKDNQAHLSSNCPIIFNLRNAQAKRVRRLATALDNPTVGMQVLSEVDMSFPPQSTNRLSGQVQLVPQTNLAPTMAFNGRIKSEFQLVPSEWPKVENLKVQSDFSARIPDFKNLVDDLSESLVAIPAPFHTLRGAIALNTSGTLTTSGGNLATRLNTDLQSAHQSLKTKSLANLQLRFHQMRFEKVVSKADVRLEDVKLALLPIDGTGLPSFFPDRRIRRASLQEIRNDLLKTDSKTSFLQYDIQVQTPQKQPLQLISNITDEPIRIGLELRMRSQQPTKGKVSIFPTEYEIAGIEGEIARTDLNIYSSQFQTPVAGKITSGETGEETRFIYSMNPSDSLLRPQPKLPLPLLELITAMNFETPLSAAVVNEDRPNSPQHQTAQSPFHFQIRGRY